MGDKQMDYTERELELLSNGILALLDNVGEARKILSRSGNGCDKNIIAYMNELKALNTKICNIMKK